MKFTHFGLSLACAGALAFTQMAVAQDQDQDQSGQQSSSQQTTSGTQSASQGQVKLSSHDQKFIRSAAENDLASIQAGQIAQQKSQNPQVKQFAQDQVQTHQNMMNQLNNIAQQNNVNLPTQLNSSDQKAISRLQSASASNFDQEYSRWATQNHQKALNTFQKEAQSGQNPAVKSFASSNVSTLQNNLQQAQNLQRGTSAAAGTSSGQSAGQGQGQSGQMGQSSQGQSSQGQSSGGQAGQQSNPY